ncbi:hypothetical protein BU17DRAFT_63456 [Hysterangium stoloniferum]|nr:hypothetical protein BU17DRAFT_63456 [Hysterangium stoloniferum]
MYEPVHVLSKKSTRQHRNVFICQDRYHPWEEAETYTLFPVEVGPSIVLTYSVHKNGAGLSRKSQDIIAPGDYGLRYLDTGNPALYFFFDPVHPFSSMEEAMEEDSRLLSAKVSLTAPIIQQALDRDRQCIFSGVVPSCGSDALVATWVFPPFLGYKAKNKYNQNPNACDLSDLMVVENVVSGRRTLSPSFGKTNWALTLKPSDRFLRLHFQECLAVSACRGDVMEDYHEQEIENFMEELGVYDGEIDTGDPRWSTPLGSHVHAYLIRQKMAEKHIGSKTGTCLPANYNYGKRA